MASKWRQNIPDCGLSHTVFTLAARKLEDPTVLVCRFGVTTLFWIERNLSGVPEQVSGFATVVFNPDPSVGFPFGIPVEPD